MKATLGWIFLSLVGVFALEMLTTGDALIWALPTFRKTDENIGTSTATARTTLRQPTLAQTGGVLPPPRPPESREGTPFSNAITTMHHSCAITRKKRVQSGSRLCGAAARQTERHGRPLRLLFAKWMTWLTANPRPLKNAANNSPAGALTCAAPAKTKDRNSL